MKVTSHQIETWAVGKVEDVFSRSSRIQSFIPSGDKEPAWDGCIHIESDDKSRKKIPIQVKGKTCRSLPKNPSYSVKVCNLKSYLKDGGVLYCVVFILREERLLYYAKLTPIELKKFIEEAKDQATISIPLCKYDKDVAEMEIEMNAFFDDCKKQTSFVDAPIMTLDEAIKNGCKISFSSSFTQKENGNCVFSEEPVYLYAVMEGGGAKAYYPIGDQRYKIAVGPHIKEDVVANGKTYYKEYTLFSSGDERTLCIDEVVNIHYHHIDGKTQQNATKISSKARMLSSKIHELHFIQDMFISGKVNFGQNLFELKNTTKSQINLVSTELDYWIKARELFNRLNITEDIEIGRFSEVDIGNLTILIDAILDSKPISNQQDLNTVACMDIDKYKILLLTEKNKDGTYTISDFFGAADKMYWAYKEGDEEMLKTSMFTVVFNHPDFKYFSNVDYSKMLLSYEEAVSHNPSLPKRANDDMLMALKAYDSIPKKDDKMYNAILSLNSWIIEKSLITNKPLHIVNKYQIIKRKRSLTKDEAQELCNILLLPNLGADMKTAIHLLLDNKTMANISYEEMNAEQQDLFDSFPISIFRKDNIL